MLRGRRSRNGEKLKYIKRRRGFGEMSMAYFRTVLCDSFSVFCRSNPKVSCFRKAIFQLWRSEIVMEICQTLPDLSVVRNDFRCPISTDASFKLPLNTFTPFSLLLGHCRVCLWEDGCDESQEGSHGNEDQRCMLIHTSTLLQ